MLPCYNEISMSCRGFINQGTIYFEVLLHLFHMDRWLSLFPYCLMKLLPGHHLCGNAVIWWCPIYRIFFVSFGEFFNNWARNCLQLSIFSVYARSPLQWDSMQSCSTSCLKNSPTTTKPWWRLFKKTLQVTLRMSWQAIISLLLSITVPHFVFQPDLHGTEHTCQVHRLATTFQRPL